MMFIVLLLAACSSGDGEASDTRQKVPPVINIYVHSPNNPVITRGDVGEVNPINNTANESLITSLQIWVFNNGTGDLISYYSPESVDNLNETAGTASYQLSVSEAFASAAEAGNKPNVDVYVLANAASCNMTFGEKTSRTSLEDAMITSDFFGLTTLTDKVPESGLPMSGVLRNVPVDGSSPVYRLQNVSLTRAVSKIRFVLCKETPAQGQENIAVSINSICLNAGMIPNNEYMFLETGTNANPYRVDGFNTDDAKEFLSGSSLTDLPSCEDPLQYAYQSQNAQDYENLIAEGVAAGKLIQKGPYYLRESDKQLRGIIRYQKGGEDAKNATFEMKTAGDFSRNHTWIVYVFYSKSGLVAITVVLKDWNEHTDFHEVYNW